MRARILAVCLFLTVSTVAFAGETYVVDSNHSDVTFQIRHLVSKVSGRFGDFSGTIDFDRAKPERSSVDFVIRTASIDTNVERRDNHLRSADFFDVQKYPEITFHSTKIVPAGKDRFNVSGDFTMHGVTKQITLPVTITGFMKDPGGKERAGFEASTVLDRKDYGVVWNRTLDSGGYLLGDDVTIEIALETVHQDPATVPEPSK
ncbi:MAG: YceI family protein [Thermoanaerobaculia bacterium]